MEKGLYIGWLAEQGERVVGGCGLTLLEWGPTKQDLHPWRARVVNVFTDPAVRRQGVARILLQAAIQEAQRRGINTLSLGTSEMARTFYEDMGFTAYPNEMLKRGR